MCTHNSVQPVPVKKGPCGTHQCHNPKIRSESFLLLSRINQIFNISTILLKRQVFHLNKCSLVEGEYLINSLFKNKCSRWILPIRLRKAYFNQKFLKNTIWYAIFEGEKKKMWLKYDVKYAKSEKILCELDSELTQELMKQ